MSRSWKVEECAKKKKKITRGDDQSAISSKEHVKYGATQTYLSATCKHDRLHLTGKRPQQCNGVWDHSNSKAHRLYFSKSLLGGNKHQTRTMRYRDKCVLLTGFFRRYCLLTTTFAYRSLTTGGTIIFPLVFHVENVSPACWYTLAPCRKKCHRQKHIVCNRAPLCVILPVRTYNITCTRVHTMSICPKLYNTTPRGPGDAATRNVAVGLFWGSNQNHYY